jgi:hypothetical protein
MKVRKEIKVCINRRSKERSSSKGVWRCGERKRGSGRGREGKKGIFEYRGVNQSIPLLLLSIGIFGVSRLHLLSIRKPPARVVSNRL